MSIMTSSQAVLTLHRELVNVNVLTEAPEISAFSAAACFLAWSLPLLVGFPGSYLPSLPFSFDVPQPSEKSHVRMILG